MENIRELGNTLSFGDVQNIYERGNKIAISFGNNTSLGCVDCISYDGDDVKNLDNPTVADGFILDNGEVILRADSLVVLDKVYKDSTGCLADVKPLGGKYSDWYLTICLYVDEDLLKIADRVVEVKL